MANKKFWVGMLVMVLAFGMAVVGCDNNGGDDWTDDWTPPVREAITGTVTVTSNAILEFGIDSMRLTANVSGSNATNFWYEWLVDGVRGTGQGATSQTYTLAAGDAGREIRVRVHNPNTHTGSIYSTPQTFSPTTLVLNLQRHPTIWGLDTGIVIVRGSGGHWVTVAGTPSPFGNLPPEGASVTLTSWSETNFRIRTQYTMIGTEFFFRLNTNTGSETFPFNNGTRTYTLQFVDGGFGILTGLVAVEN